MSRAPVDVERLLAALGIKAELRGTKWLASCPAPDHPDENPSWFIRDDPGERWHGSHNCRSCGLSGGPWELVSVVRGIPLDEAAKFVAALSGGPRELPRDVPEVKVVMGRRRRVYQLPPGVEVPASIAEWKPAALAYLRKRSITDDQILRWGIGFATVGPLAWRVVVPVIVRGRLVAYVGRAIFDDGRPRYDMPSRVDGARPDVAVWGEPGFDRTRGAITVAEGIFSALALERCGAPNPCALLGSQLTPQKIAVLSEWPVILVATDPDKAGDKVAEDIGKQLSRHCWVQRVTLDASPDDADPRRLRNALQAAAAGFANVWLEPAIGDSPTRIPDVGE